MLYPSSTTAALFFICVASTIYTSLAFAPALPFQTRLYTTACVDTAQCASRNEDDEDTTAESEIPCLPPIGESSFTGESSSATNSADSEDSETIRIGTERFELQYTCKICETRNSHKVSRMAYRNGIVITVCKGCSSKHLIADNLGWTKYAGGFDGDTNIEEFMNTHGRGDEVNRVSKEVFDLEGILKNNANGIASELFDISSDAENSFE